MIRNVFLKTLNLSILFFLSFSANAADVTWSNVSLSQEDSRGAHALLALIRNFPEFSKWLKGNDLGERTQILVRRSTQSPAVPRIVEDKRVNGERVAATEKVEQLRFVVSERDENNSSAYKRLLLVKEEIITRVSKVVAGPNAGKVVSSSVSYNYPAMNVSEENLDSASSEAYKKAADLLYAEGGPECTLLANANFELCRISEAATKLIRVASRKSSQLETLVPQVALDKETAIKESKKFYLDSTSAKYVSFEESTKGAIRNVVLSGFIQSVDEKLEAPDAVSAWVVKFDSATKVYVEQRRPLDSEKVDLEKVKFE